MPSASRCSRGPCSKLRKFWACRKIFHCHDWQSALVPVLLRTIYAEDPAFRDVGTVFTIHNMGYQGLFPPETLPLLTLPWDLFTMSKMEFFGQVNFLKGRADLFRLHHHRQPEIQPGNSDRGIRLWPGRRAARPRRHRDRNSEWRRLRRVEPADRQIHRRQYSPQDLSGKAKCKQDLAGGLSACNADPKLPVIGIVSRFAAQKGFDLIAQIMDRLAREEMIVVALGAGDKTYEEMFLRLNKQFPNKIAVKVAYDNAIAHKIEAGADMFLMPSRYEPCGLNQIYSLKYGTVPIVRATGGLDDTIEALGRALRQGHRLQVHRIQRRIAAADHQAGAAGLPRPDVVAGADAQRHEQGFFLERLGARVRQDL